jgi:hypothetical protein
VSSLDQITPAAGHPATEHRSHARRRASGRGGPGRARAGAVSVGAAVILGVIAVIIATAGATPRPAATYGRLPSWLPRPAVHVGRLVTASRRHRWVAIEGDTVRVELGPGSALATVVGPRVPHQGQFPVPETTSCSFTVTLTGSSGVVPVRASAFTIVGEDGRLYHPRVRVTGARGLPARVRRGRTVVLTVSSVLPTGAGQLRWSPGGGRPISAWDFDVEID